MKTKKKARHARKPTKARTKKVSSRTLNILGVQRRPSVVNDIKGKDVYGRKLGGFTPPTGPANPGRVTWATPKEVMDRAEGFIIRGSLTDGVIADAWGRAQPVLSVTRSKESYPPILFATVRTPSGHRGKQALVTGAGYPIDAAVADAWVRAGSWATPKSTFDRVARSFR